MISIKDTHKKRILFLEEFYQNQLGGGQKVTLSIIESYKKQKIDLIYTGKNNKFKKLLNSKDVKFIQINYNKYINRLIYFYIVIKNVIYSDYNIIVANTKLSGLAVQIGSLFLLSNKQKELIVVHHLSPKNKGLIVLISRYLHYISKCKFLVSSKFLLKKFKQSKLIPKESVNRWGIISKVIIDLPDDGLILNDMDLIYTNNNILESKENVRIGYLGLIHPKKGIFDLILLLNKISKKYYLINKKKFSLYILGDGSIKNKLILKSLITNANFKINYYGIQSINKRIYKELNAVIVPSWNIEETLSFTALESINYCKKTLLAKNGVLKEYIDEINTISIEKNPDSLLRSLQKIQK